MTEIDPQTRHSMPAAHALQLLQLVQRWQVTEAELFSELGVCKRALSDPEMRLPIATMVALLERARTLTAEPGLGVYLGLQARVSGHGFLGFAAMSASTFAEAIALAIRYAPIRSTALAFRGHVEGSTAVLTIDEHADFGSARDIILLSMLIGLRQIGCVLTGRELDLSLDLSIPEPPYFARFAHSLPATRFGQPFNRLSGPAQGLRSPLAFADPEGTRIAREQCERLLASLGLDGRVEARVRAALAKTGSGFRSLEAVADELGLSARTLRRRLEAEGVSFAAMLDTERKDRALTLLRSGELSVDDIASRLGYADAANFTRAFRRWTGTSPTAFRKTNG